MASPDWTRRVEIFTRVLSRKKAFCRIDGMIEGVAEDTIKEQTGEGTKTVKNWIFT